MSKFKRYIFNPDTLSYEVMKMSVKVRFLRGVGFFLASVVAACLYVWIYTSVLGYKLPKTVILEKINARWTAKMDIMNSQLDHYDNMLTMLQVRDDDVYRSVFGMNEISDAVRNAGFGGVDRYAWIEESNGGKMLKETMMRLDVITKKTYIQSKSFDDVLALSKRAGDMASCIPSIPPVDPTPGTYRISSTFGRRTDPITGRSASHEGVDFACKTGNPIYATADGVVESVKSERFGYGKHVVINHGFGYKTRYAHMDEISVREGDRVVRGRFIGTAGNTGKSTGPHLHYEVLYRNAHVNPYNYYDLNMMPDEYASLTMNANSGVDGTGASK